MGISKGILRIFGTRQTSHGSHEQSSAPISFPDGVKILHDCPDATVDICFIHGLTGNRDSTWTAHGQSAPWPETLLPPEIGKARILTYGYDAYIVRKSVASSNRLIDHATNFLNDLTTDRARYNASSRAVIFIAHSLGGLVCKKAILLSRNNPEPHLQGVFNCTKGIVFMGTPHKGAWMADWAKIPASTLGIVKSVNKSLLQILETDNQLLEAIQIDFWSMIRELRENGRRIDVTCFFEELPLPGVGKVVSKESATLEGYSSFSIHSNHSNMVKFGSAEETGFMRLLGELLRWGSDISNLYTLDDKELRCLKDLWAPNPEHEKARIEHTKGGLQQDVYSWILENPDYQKWRDDQQSRLLWIRGDPGKGKTMLVCGIVDELKKSKIKSQLLSFFFCQASDARLNNATAVLRALICQLINQQPSLISHIKEGYIRQGKELFEDINSWFAMSETLINMLGDHNSGNIILVIDGLDECQVNLRELLDMIMENSSLYSHVKWVISSRNWPSIHERLNAAGQLSMELNAESVTAAVDLYIQQKISHLAEKKQYDPETRDAVKQHLVKNSEGTFLWVALVCQYLQSITSQNIRTKLQNAPRGLGPLYKRMMKEMLESSTIELDDVDLCKRILAVMAVVYRPITLKELASLVKISEISSDNTEVSETEIGLCGSFLTLRYNTVYFVHHSAKEFLVQTSEIFPSGIEKAHYMVCSRSLQAMGGTLKRDIYSLRTPGCLVDNIEAKQPEKDPLASVCYSCIYWVNHMHDYYSRQISKRHEEFKFGDMVDEFLQKKYLQWLEALSLLRSIPEGVLAVTQLVALVQQQAEGSELLTLIRDAHRFILYFKGAIEIAPLQVYYSALVFSPTNSFTHKLFEEEKPSWVRTNAAVEGGWSACLQTLEGHYLPVNSTTFSHDSKLLASASQDKTVRIWDTSSGKCLNTIKGHRDSVTSVVFSHDSKLLASGSQDKTAKIWETRNGQCLQTLKLDADVVSVIFSQDSKLLASFSKTSFEGNDNGAISIFNTSSGQCLQTIERDNFNISSMTFLHDSKNITSVSRDATINIWDINNGQCLQTRQVCHVGIPPFDVAALSYDSKILAFALNLRSDKTVKVWDTSNGQCLHTLEGHISYIYSIDFSHDSKHLATGSHDETIKIWDISNDPKEHYLQTPKSHSGQIDIVNFSHDNELLATGSTWDNVIKIWDTHDGQCLQTIRLGHDDGKLSLSTFSYDGKILASAQRYTTVKIWNISTGGCLHVLKCEHEFQSFLSDVSSLMFSYDSKLLASISWDDSVNIWDMSNGQCLQNFAQMENPDVGIRYPLFKPYDSTHLATVSMMHIQSGKPFVGTCQTNEGQCLQTFDVAEVILINPYESTNSCLSTNKGIIQLLPVSDRRPAGTGFELQKRQGCGISPDKTWITWNSENLLWLPPEYRPSVNTVAPLKIGIGCLSRQVLILNFDYPALLDGLVRHRSMLY